MLSNLALWLLWPIEYDGSDVLGFRTLDLRRLAASVSFLLEFFLETSHHAERKLKQLCWEAKLRNTIIVNKAFWKLTHGRSIVEKEGKPISLVTTYSRENNALPLPWWKWSYVMKVPPGVVGSPWNSAPIKDSVLISDIGIWTPSSGLREYPIDNCDNPHSIVSDRELILKLIKSGSGLTPM